MHSLETIKRLNNQSHNNGAAKQEQERNNPIVKTESKDQSFLVFSINQALGFSSSNAEISALLKIALGLAGVIDKKLENVILKSIAAFGNVDGGTLLIGVDDDGQAVGLDRDFNSLKGNKDEFELHLRNLINYSFGKLFATSTLKIEFPTVNDIEICKIEISPSAKPVYLEIPDKNGQKTKKFYVRSGNSSQELDISEVNDHINSRWNGK